MESTRRGRNDIRPCWPSVPGCWHSRGAGQLSLPVSGSDGSRPRRPSPNSDGTETVWQDCPVSAEGGTKAVVAALAANIFIAVTKFAAWALTGASSMLAEAIHSVADSGNQVLLLVGGRRARRAATPEHPFGYGRERYVFGFIVAVVLFSVGGLFAVYEGVHKLREPEELTSPIWAIGVLVIAIALEGYSLRTAVKEAAAVKSPDDSY